MKPLAWFFIALAVAFAAGLCFYPALSWNRRKRALALLVLAVPILSSPFWVPYSAPFLRALLAMNATAMTLKLYDLHAFAHCAPRPNFSAFAFYLPNWYSVVWRRLPSEPRPTTRENLIRLVRNFCGMVLGIAVCAWLSKQDWSAAPFMLEHSIKSVAFFSALIPGSAVAVSLWRLAGGRARDFMGAPLLAATPADFWRRYNRPAYQFFYEDVFKSIGAFRSPVRAMLVTFVISAVIHEYVFGAALGRIQGYQTVFFLVQGVGVAATVRLRLKGKQALLGLVATWIFNLTTSVFFFASIYGIFRIYSGGLPGWLAGW